MILGAGLLALMVLPPVANAVHEPPGLGAAIFIVVMLPLLSIPGILCLWFGYQLFQRRTEESLRLIVGTVVFMVTFSIYVRMEEIFSVRFSEEGWDVFGMLMVALVVAVAYPLAISRLHPAIGGGRKSPGKYVGRGFLALIAWLLFFALSSAQHTYLRDLIEMEITGLPLVDAMVQLLIVLSPFLIPYCGYKIAVRFLIEKET